MADYQKIHLSTLLKYYKRSEIQRALVSAATKKEIAVSFGGTGYGKRPDVLHYEKDVLEFVKQGATSFHCSEELWNNPLSIVTGMRPEELASLRLGWDLILDIDCKELEYSKLGADLLVQALRHHGVKHLSVKFSGNHGFHIGVPFEAFPETVNGVPTKSLFPEGPRRIAAYLQEMIRAPLSQRLLALHDIVSIAQRVGKTSNELVKGGVFDPFAVLGIDTILIASRHLYRMPYSLNEKSGLVSVVIRPEEIMKFEKENARPERVVPQLEFLSHHVAGEAKKLIVQAFDFKLPEEKIELKKREFVEPSDAVPEAYFPPCIKAISQGLKDGKKRAVFVLINFLRSVGWEYDAIENYLKEWNKKNPEPLREVFIVGHLRYHKAQQKKVLPPNCINNGYMVDMGVCQPDNFCGANVPPGATGFAPRIKNPANYAIARQRRVARENEGKKR